MVKRNTEGLTAQEMALIFCILGTPDPNSKEGYVYPTIEGSLSYIKGGSMPKGMTNDEYRLLT